MQEQIKRVRKYLETTNNAERKAITAELLTLSEKLTQEENTAFLEWRQKGKKPGKAKERYIYANARLCLFSEVLQLLEGEPVPKF